MNKKIQGRCSVCKKLIYEGEEMVRTPYKQIPYENDNHSITTLKRDFFCEEHKDTKLI